VIPALAPSCYPCAPGSAALRRNQEWCGSRSRARRRLPLVPSGSYELPTDASASAEERERGDHRPRVLFVSRAHAVFGGPEALAPLGLVTLAFPGGVKDLCRVLSADHYDPVGVAQHDVAGSHRDAAAADRVVHRAEPALVRSPDREAAGEDRKAQLRDRRSVAHEAIDHEAGGALRASLLGEQVPQGPPSQAPRSPRRAPAGPPTPPTAPRFGVSGQERLDREVRRGDLERRSESGDDREEADVAQRRARLKRNHRLGGGAIRWLRWQVGLDLVDQLPERLVRVLAALALEPVDQRGVAGRGRRGDARQAARVHGEAQHVDRRLEQCRVDPLPEEGGGAVDIRGMVIATRREATVRSGAVASAGSPVRAPSDGTYLGCQAGGAVR
jgi:hypothetical protein